MPFSHREGVWASYAFCNFPLVHQSCGELLRYPGPPEGAWLITTLFYFTKNINLKMFEYLATQLQDSSSTKLAMGNGSKSVRKPMDNKGRKGVVCGLLSLFDSPRPVEPCKSHLHALSLVSLISDSFSTSRQLRFLSGM